MSKHFIFCILFLVAACAHKPDTEQTIRTQIEESIARNLDATKRKDIDAYMAEIPGDFVLYDESGTVVSRDQQRADVLRDWSIILKTLSISTTIDSLTVQGENATIFTSGRWERLMLRPDGKNSDRVLTTQRHQEQWRKTANGWKSYDIKAVIHNHGPEDKRWPRPQDAYAAVKSRDTL